MKGNSQPNNLFNPSTPNLFSIRQRLNSINSPFISPLRIVHSPILANNDSLFDFQLRNQNFQLEPQHPIEDQKQQEVDSEQIQSEEQEKQQVQDISNIIIDENNALDIILKHVNIRDKQLNQLINKACQKADNFHCQLYEYIHKKFKKLRKTKQEMIKYSIRKAFRHITDQLKKQMPNYAVDSNDYLQYYFQKFQEDQSITVPFKKDSLEKTMNSAFLKKIFACEQFICDYKVFIRSFKKQYTRDNQKKVDNMKEVIKSCVNKKCLKGLQNFKRLPWTYEILGKLDEFSKQLLQYAPKGSYANKPDEMLNKDPQMEEYSIKIDEYHHKKEQQQIHKSDSIKYKTKSIILLTPPMGPLTSPTIPDLND